jgi:arylsulfatase A-like enzyme
MLTIVAGANGISLVEQGGKTGPPIQTLGEDILVDRTLRVPLVLYSTAALEGPAVRSVPVELLDVFPTLAAAAGAVPPTGLPGRDLRAPTEEDAATAYAYAEFGDMLALRSGPYFLMYRCLLHYGTSLDPEVTRRLVDNARNAPRRMGLYQVTTDPFQERPERDPDLHRTLHQRMIGIRLGEASVPAEAMTPQRLYEIRMARSNGYW